MTIRRDLKRKIRERQDKTGESYTAARAHVLAQRPQPKWVVELHDVAEHAHIACPVRVTSTLSRMGSLADILDRLHQILASSVEGVESLKRAVRGEPEPLSRTQSMATLIADVRRFRENLRNGLRGAALGGHLIAFDVQVGGQTRTVVAQLLPRHTRKSLLVLSLYPDDGLFDSLEPWPVKAYP